MPTNGGLLLAVVLGVRLARAGWGREPARHRRGLLGVGAAAGLVGLLGSVPYARVLGSGRLPDVVVGLWAGVLDAVTGPVGALGAVCLLLAAAAAPAPAHGSARRRAPAASGPGRSALALLGRRSLLVYLAHSVVLALVLAPWAGGAGQPGGARGGGDRRRRCGRSRCSGRWSRGSTAGRPPGRLTGRLTGRRQPSERQGRDRSSAT